MEQNGGKRLCRVVPRRPGQVGRIFRPIRRRLGAASIKRRMLLRAGALAVLLVLLVSGPVMPCIDIDADASKYKIVIGKLKYTVNGTETSITKDHSMAIRSEMWSRFGNVSENTIPAICADRSWNDGGNDHVGSLLEGLNDRNVLLELWGEVSENEIENVKYYSADVCMVLIPLRQHEMGENNIDFCLLSLKRVGKGDFVAAVTDMILGTEFEIYVYLAHAYKAFQNDEFVKAKFYLGKASLTIASEKGEEIEASLSEKLIQYIENMNEKILEADPTLGPGGSP